MENKWFCIQHGDNFDWDNGSYDVNEARKMAEELHEDYPGEEIRLCQIDEGYSFCDWQEVIYEEA